MLRGKHSEPPVNRYGWNSPEMWCYFLFSFFCFCRSAVSLFCQHTVLCIKLVTHWTRPMFVYQKVLTYFCFKFTCRCFSGLSVDSTKIHICHWQVDNLLSLKSESTALVIHFNPHKKTFGYRTYLSFNPKPGHQWFTAWGEHLLSFILHSVAQRAKCSVNLL